jgi:hypothetical protein
MNSLRNKRFRKTERKRTKYIKNRNIKNKKTKKIFWKGGKKKETIMMEKVNCSPKDKKEINDFSCYKNDDLHKMRNLWNARHPDHLIQTNTPLEIHRLLSLFMKDSCNKESCWLKQNFLQGSGLKKEMIDSFAPIAPKEWKKDPNEWLSSVDIHKVMKQYEKAYKCFDFIGPTPIDFDTKKMYGDCVWEELCHFNLAKEIEKGRFKIGVVFNTDPHYKSGSHWISLFINVKKAQIYFFDSAGDPAPKEIRVLVDRVVTQGKNLKKPIYFKYDENYPVEHQYGNTECGVYALFFIIYMLEDKLSANYLKTHRISDKAIEKYRKIFFNDGL